MSIIKSIQREPQPNRRRREPNVQNDKREKLPVAELWIILIIALVGLVALGIVSYYRINEQSVRIKFFTDHALTFITLLAIVFQAIVYRRQWSAMRRSLKQTDSVIEKMQGQLAASEKQAKIMEESLVATQKLVEHSEISIQAAERNTRYAQRAYVTVTKREAIETGFNLTIENSGNTPAIGVAVQIVVDLGHMEPKLPEDDVLQGYTSIGLLAPRDSYEMFVPFSRAVTEEEKEWFDDPTWGLNWWCVGSIYYRDIFQTNVVDYRQTNFAFYQDRVNGKVQAGGFSGNEVKEHYATDENQENPNQPSTSD